MRSAELAIIIQYPTSASGIIVLLKTAPKYRKLDYNKNKKAQKITHTFAIFVDHGIMAHYTMMVNKHCYQPIESPDSERICARKVNPIATI